MATQDSQNPLLSLSQDKQQQLVDLVEDGNINAVADATGMERRDILKIAAALGVGTVAGGISAQELISEARAAASTTDGDGNVGLPGDRVDVFAESADVTNEISSGSINTEGASIGSQYDGDVIDVSAHTYDAPEYGNGDGTDAVQQAINDADGGGTVVFPFPVAITSTLDLTNRHGITFKRTGGHSAAGSHWGFNQGNFGYGGIVWDGGNGQIMVDATGAYDCVFSCDILTHPATDTPDAGIGILSARSGDEPEPAAPCLFQNARFDGRFYDAGFYNVNKEGGHFVACNSVLRGNSAVIEHNPTNTLGVASVHDVIDNTYQQATSWRYHNCVFKTTNGVCYRGYDGIGDHHFRDCFLGSTGPAVELDTSEGDIQNPITLDGVRFEGSGGDGSAIGRVGTNPIRGLTVSDPSFLHGSSSNPVIDLTGGSLISSSIQMDDGILQTGASTDMIFGTIEECDIDIRRNVTVDVSTAINRSQVLLPNSNASLTGAHTTTGSDIRVNTMTP